MVMLRTANPPSSVRFRPRPRIAVLILLSLLFFLPLNSYCAVLFSFDSDVVDAADSGDISTLTSLLRNSADVNQRGTFDTTALMRASFRGHYSVVELLLNYNADVHLVDIGGATALHFAARRGHNRIADLLMQYGASAEIADKTGYSPMMRAVQAGATDVVKVMLRHGADVLDSNIAGKSVLGVAENTGNKRILDLLSDNSIGLFERDSEEKDGAMDENVESGTITPIPSDVRTTLAAQEYGGFLPGDKADKGDTASDAGEVALKKTAKNFKNASAGLSKTVSENAPKTFSKSASTAGSIARLRSKTVRSQMSPKKVEADEGKLYTVRKKGTVQDLATKTSRALVTQHSGSELNMGIDGDEGGGSSEKRDKLTKPPDTVKNLVYVVQTIQTKRQHKNTDLVEETIRHKKSAPKQLRQTSLIAVGDAVEVQGSDISGKKIWLVIKNVHTEEAAYSILKKLSKLYPLNTYKKKIMYVNDETFKILIGMFNNTSDAIQLCVRARENNNQITCNIKID